MEKIKPFDDFLSNLILEQIGQGNLPFKLSKRLVGLLDKIDHEIAERLIEDHEEGTPAKFTLIDLDEKQIDMFTYATSPKITEYVIKNTNTEDLVKNLKYYDGHAEVRSEMWTVNRSPIKIGKLINKIYPDTYINAGKPGKDIESFVNAIKSEREKNEGSFKIVTGQDIVKYYDTKKYDKGTYSGLHNSCMAYSHCAPYIEFYAKNNVELVILMGEGDTIKGRAILWTITRLDGQKVERKFMDRIYTIQQHDVGKFTNLAQQNEWLYKDVQDMYAETRIVDSIDGTVEKRTMKIKDIKEHKAYPYMDTMKYFNIRNGYLTNDEYNAGEEFVVLESADGGYIEDNGSGDELAFDEYTGELVNEDDMVWLDNEERNMSIRHAIHSEFVSEYASPEYAKEHWEYSKLEKDWIPKDDMVYVASVKQWMSEDYAQENFNMCDYDEEYYKTEDTLDSTAYNYVPKNKAIFVIDNEDVDLKEYNRINNRNYSDIFSIDVRYKGDKSYFTIVGKNGKEYHLDLELKGSDLVKQIKKGVI